MQTMHAWQICHLAACTPEALLGLRSRTLRQPYAEARPDASSGMQSIMDDIQNHLGELRQAERKKKR